MTLPIDIDYNQYLNESQESTAAPTQNDDDTIVVVSSMAWPNQVTTLSSPMLLGHIKDSTRQQDQENHTNILHLPIPLSPITSDSSSKHIPFLNEQYSLCQMHSLDNTILLPVNVVTPFECNHS